MMLLCGLRIILYFPHNIIIIHGAQRAADACLTNDGETIWDRTGPRWQVSIQAHGDLLHLVGAQVIIRDQRQKDHCRL